MKTAEEVLKAWDICHNGLPSCAGCPYDSQDSPCVGFGMEFGEMEADVRAVLEKQVPKAPTAKPHKDDGGNGYSDFYCSGCGNGIGHNCYGRLYNLHMESVNDYCENCGQAIEWEGCER